MFVLLKLTLLEDKMDSSELIRNTCMESYLYKLALMEVPDDLGTLLRLKPKIVYQPEGSPHVSPFGPHTFIEAVVVMPHKYGSGIVASVTPCV